VLRGIAQTCDDVLGDYGNARVAALAVTLSEMVAFGRDYAQAIVANARALAGALAAEGFTVAGADQGFTSSHQVLVYPRDIRALDVVTALATARILCSLVPLRAGADTVTGLRLGTSSVTRRGMTPVEMRELARLIARLLLHGEEPEAIGKEVRALRARFTIVQYAFPA
jgi:glycine hydroxymethyltransferase